MKVIEVHRQIIAKPDRVWSVLTDAAKLASGGLGIVRIEGSIVEGGKIALESASAPGRIFNLKIAEFDRPGRMVWKSGAPLIFNGTRTFSLKPTPRGTDFHMAEVFTGLMLPLIWRSMPDLKPGFELFADGLKRLAEGV